MTAPRLSSFQLQQIYDRRAALGIGPDGKRITPEEATRSRDEVAEAVIQAACEDYLDSIGDWFFHDWTRKKLKAGIPDLIICHRGRFVAVELKTKTGKPSPEQSGEIARIHRAGGIAGVARSVEELRGILAEAEA